MVGWDRSIVASRGRLNLSLRLLFRLAVVAIESMVDCISVSSPLGGDCTAAGNAEDREENNEEDQDIVHLSLLEIAAFSSLSIIPTCA